MVLPMLVRCAGGWWKSSVGRVTDAGYVPGRPASVVLAMFEQFDTEAKFQDVARPVTLPHCHCRLVHVH